jgi:hypothetical protein
MLLSFKASYNIEDRQRFIETIMPVSVRSKRAVSISFETALSFIISIRPVRDRRYDRRGRGEDVH